MARATFVPPPPADTVSFIPSGSTLLDLVLGGGYARGRVTNIVGDKSAGKTLLAIESCANFARLVPKGIMRYAEAESAFDLPYALSMGLPSSVQMASTDDSRIDTVEKFDADLGTHLEKTNHSLYILDSLDALSDGKEMERELGEATYGMAKAKLMSEMFRKRITQLRDRDCALLVISQIRDKINVSFGETKTRAGGHALDFYSSQIIWLAEIKKLTRTVLGSERVVGVQVEVKNKKNKVGKPFRRAEFTILFNYGIDDETSMLDWLVRNKADGQLDRPHREYRQVLEDMREERDRDGLRSLQKYLAQVVTDRWERIEEALQPPINKYG